MRKLEIRLMGPFQVKLDGQILTNFRSNKVRALLAYLAVEAKYPWTRSQLSDLLWPDYPEQKAQSNLRNALWNLRHVLQDTNSDNQFIIVNKLSVQFNQISNYHLDTQTFTNLVEELNQPSVIGNLPEYEKSLSKYQDTFMNGLYIESPVFETWILKTRQNLHSKLLQSLRFFMTNYYKSGMLSAALDHANNLVELEPWEEEGYRMGMQILADLGQRNAAIHLFNKCKTRLSEDLNIEPQNETTQIFNQILNNQSNTNESQFSETSPINRKIHAPPGQVPQFLIDKLEEKLKPNPFFARQKELAQLEQWLLPSLKGQGRVGFVVGDPGSGKTFLLDQFIKKSLERFPDLIVLQGKCNAYTGQGDPYFPFMNITRIMAGDISSHSYNSLINVEQINRFWNSLPLMLHHLCAHGSGLIREFIKIENVISILQTHPGITETDLQSLETILQTSSKFDKISVPITDQFSQVLFHLSNERPLMIILDDLQWIDTGSASLLFNLGRQIKDKKIFLLGAFRPSETFLDHPERSHPMEGIYQEFQMSYGKILINLFDADGETFTKELLASEPNEFSQKFFRRVFKQTSGHPLFTIELLRGMQLRNEIIKDHQGNWVESDHLDWIKLPSKIEAVIARRIALLPDKCKPLLELASVQGDIFNIEVISAILNIPEDDIFELINESICKQHQLISALGVKYVGNQQITNFEFRHVLFQIYLYNELNVIEKLRLHGLVGNALEELFQDHLNQFPEMTHTIARHFELANLGEKAVNYLLLAGKYAVQLSANQEAVEHYYHALDLLQTLPHSKHRDELEFNLQISLGPPLTVLFGWGAPEIEKAFSRAETLIEDFPDTQKLLPFLWLLKSFRLGRSEHIEADQLWRRSLRISRRINDSNLQTLAYLQVTRFYQGKFKEAKILLERASVQQDLNSQRYLAKNFGMAPAAVALCHLNNCLWVMGYSDQANRVNSQAFELAKSVDHPMTYCYVACRSFWVGAIKGDLDQIKSNVGQVCDVAQKHKFKKIELAACFFKNWLKLQNQESGKKSLDNMWEALEEYAANGTLLNRPAFLGLFAQACLNVNEIDNGLKAINESIALGEKTHEMWYQAESWRIKGDLLLLNNQLYAQEEAESCFKNAYHIAQQQYARAFELRSLIRLVHLHQFEENVNKNTRILSKTLNWFTEGLDSPELAKARELIQSAN